MAVINKSVSSSITFTQPGSENTQYRRGVLSSPVFVSTATKGIAPSVPKTGTNSITFISTALNGRGYAKSATTAIVFSQSQTNGKQHVVSASTVITFGTTVVKSRCYNVSASSSLVFTGTTNCAGSIWVRPLVTSVRFASGAFARDVQGKVYFIKSDYTSSIALKKPVFGNGQQLNSQIDIKHSRSGDVFSYKRLPNYETLVLQFDDINETLFNQIITFIKATAGTPIYYIDHKVATWYGLITTDPTELKQFAKNSCGDLYTLDINFEGTKQ